MLIVTMAGKSLSSVAGALTRLVRAVQNRRAIHALALLDERGLKDIGLTRSDVAGALASPWFEDPSRVLAERSGAGRSTAARRGRVRPGPKGAGRRLAVSADTVACNA